MYSFPDTMCLGKYLKIVLLAVFFFFFYHVSVNNVMSQFDIITPFFIYYFPLYLMNPRITTINH